jgi:hypothetical protein
MVDRDQRADVGNAEGRAGDVGPHAQFAVEEAQKVKNARPVGFVPGRYLWIDHRLHGRMLMLKHRRDRDVDMKLDATVLRVDQCALQRVSTKQRRIGMQRLAPHLEHQCQQPLQQIDRGTGRRPLLQPAEADLLGGSGDAFFLREYPHAPRVRHPAAVIKLHRRSGLPSQILDAPTLPRRRQAAAEQSLFRHFEAIATDLLSLLLRNLGDF